MRHVETSRPTNKRYRELPQQSVDGRKTRDTLLSGDPWAMILDLAHRGILQKAPEAFLARVCGDDGRTGIRVLGVESAGLGACPPPAVIEMAELELCDADSCVEHQKGDCRLTGSARCGKSHRCPKGSPASRFATDPIAVSAAVGTRKLRPLGRCPWWARRFPNS